MMSSFTYDSLEMPPCGVGESPIWDAGIGRAFLVDIIGKTISCFDLEGTNRKVWESDDFPTSVSVIDQSQLLVGLASGVAVLSQDSGMLGPVCQVDATYGNRLNEGKCDPRGRLWLGSMQTNLNPDGSGKPMDRNSGALFCFKSPADISRHTEFEFGISNTLAWSPDGGKLYFGDSIRDVIFEFDFDMDRGIPNNPKPLLEGYGIGAPDGSAMDIDGCLWNTRYGGSQLIRITPTGKVDRVLELPVSNPTSCTFAGPNLDRLILTSATFTLSEEQLNENPLEGSTLVLDVGTSGLADTRYTGEIP